MTRDEFTELIISYGDAKAEQATAYEWGTRPSDKYIQDNREAILAEYDRLTALIAQLTAIKQAAENFMTDFEPWIASQKEGVAFPAAMRFGLEYEALQAAIRAAEGDK